MHHVKLFDDIDVAIKRSSIFTLLYAGKPANTPSSKGGTMQR